MSPAEFSIRTPRGCDAKTLTDAFLATAQPAVDVNALFSGQEKKRKQNQLPADSRPYVMHSFRLFSRWIGKLRRLCAAMLRSSTGRHIIKVL